MLADVDGASFGHVRLAHGAATKTFVLREVRGFTLQGAEGLRDVPRSSHLRATL